MALSLEQYAAEYLPTRGLPWPAAPVIKPAKARPHLEPLKVKAVLWTAYGTLLAIPHGEIRFEHDQQFVTDIALRKTLDEFKMWQSMSRKPGQPEEYLRELFNSAYTRIRMAGSGNEKFPEVQAERVWDDIVKKLQMKDYKFDPSIYGPMSDYVKKIAYFYHASIQGYGAYPNAAEAVRIVHESGRVNGLLADGQCFTPAQIHKALREQDESFDVNVAFPANLRTISSEVKAKKPSDTLFKVALASLAARKIAPHEALHIGSNLDRDIMPAKRYGMKTALFAGDKASLVASGEQLKDPLHRPNALLTNLEQLAEVL
jgi:FMN phosphatase YigB (HAD superfamily)